MSAPAGGGGMSLKTYADTQIEPTSESARKNIKGASLLWRFWEETIRAKASSTTVDELDMALYRAAVQELGRRVSTGEIAVLMAENPQGGWRIQSADPQVWTLTFFLRNATFRPTPQEVHDKVCEILKIRKVVLSGAEAQAQKRVQVPPEYAARAEDADRVIPLPRVEPDAAAPWVTRFEEFVATDDEGQNIALFSILGHLETDAARERVMDSILADREASAFIVADKKELREERKSARVDRVRTTVGIVAGMMVRRNQRKIEAMKQTVASESEKAA